MNSRLQVLCSKQYYTPQVGVVCRIDETSVYTQCLLNTYPRCPTIMESPVADWQSPRTLLLHHVAVLVLVCCFNSLTTASTFIYLLRDQVLLSTLFITYSIFHPLPRPQSSRHSQVSALQYYFQNVMFPSLSVCVFKIQSHVFFVIGPFPNKVLRILKDTSIVVEQTRGPKR